jgi:hypothetical protein
MIRISYAGAAAAVLLMSACATAPQSVLLGAGGGAVVGGGVGLAIGRDATGAAVGAATGALSGGLISFLLHKGKEKDPAPASHASDAEKYPFLTRPEVRTILVPDAVEGNRYIERHRVFVIEKNSSWSKDND